MTLTRFMDRSELWKIGAWGSILPTARTRLAFCLPTWSAVGIHYTRSAKFVQLGGPRRGFRSTRG